MRQVRRFAVPLWSAMLSLFVCIPLLAPGYILSYDMVWVPHLALSRPDIWGLGSALPRAVPSDAVVAVLGSVLPAMFVQKTILVGSLFLAGMGMGRLLVNLPLAARLGAVTFYVWNPFVAERLGLGQWPLIVAYAAAPWLIAAVWRKTRWPATIIALAATAMTPATGLMGAAIALVACRGGYRERVRLFLAAVAVNSPWIVAGILHGANARSSASAVALFDVQPEAHLGRIGAALGLGGIWNIDVMPPSRAFIISAVLAFVMWAIMILGVIASRRANRGLMYRLGILGILGLGLALSGWLLPGVVGWVASHVPGGGLFRDGTRYLLLLAPFEAVAFGLGIDWLRRQLGNMQLRQFATVLLILVPLIAMPDLAWGLAGKLKPVDYPASWEAARHQIANSDSSGDILVLPFTSYRQPQWNHSRPVLDPAGRYFSRSTVVNDDLLISGHKISGEDPRAVRVGKSLRAKSLNEALSSDGIGFVVWETAAGPSGVDSSQLSKLEEVDLGSEEIRLFEVRGTKAPDRDHVDELIMSAVWIASSLTVAAAIVVGVRRAFVRKRSKR